MQDQQSSTSIDPLYHTTDYQELFENSPVALWETDITAIYTYIQKLRDSGVNDFKAHFQTHPEDVDFCLRNTKMIDVNHAAIDLYEAPNKELLLQSFGKVFGISATSFFMGGLINFAGGKTDFENELFNYTLTDKRLRVILRSHLLPGFTKDKTHIIISITNITSDYEAKIELKRTNEQLTILHSISLAILTAQSPSEIANIALQHVPHITGCDIATIFLYDFENNLGKLLSIKGAEQPQQITFPLTQWELFDTLRTGEPHYIQDFNEINPLPAIYQNLATSGLHAMVNVPILAQGELLGTLTLLAYKPASFTDENIQTAEQIAAALSVSFHNANLFEIERRAHHQAEILREVASSLNTNLDLQALLEIILDRLASVIPFDGAYIVLTKNNLYEFACESNLHPTIAFMLADHIDKLSNIAKVLQTQRPLLIKDTSAYPGWVKFPDNDDIQCWLGVPILLKGKLIGILALQKTEVGFYDEADKSLAQAFASQTGIAIENARLYQRIQQYSARLETRVQERTRELQVLYNVTAVAGKPLDLNTILQHTLAELDSILNITMSAIHICDADKMKLVLACHQGLNDPLAQQIQTIFLPDTLFGQVFVKDNAHVIEASAAHEHLLAALENFAGIPIHIKGNTIGVLSVFGNIVPTLKTEDLALLGTVADHIGSIIENDNLSTKAQQLAVIQERKRLAQDLHDSITQSLYSMTLFAEAAHDLASTGDTVNVQKYIQEISLSAQQAFKEMRLMLYELRVDTFIPEGLEQALRHRLERVEDRTGLHFSLSVDVPADLPPPIQEGLYRIAREALNNTLKHSEAHSVTISTILENDILSMLISDDGKGFDLQTAQVQNGMGLNIMQERATALGAICTFTSTPSQGTHVQIDLPLNRPVAGEVI